jgi:putative PIN family toxin of toxin-antitoxin system
MALSGNLARAYRDAEYVVFGEPDIVLRIGVPSARLDALLAGFGAAGAAFLTAVNPGSEPRGAAENRAAMEKLDAALAAANYSRLPGEGRDPKGGWREPSVLVPGLARAEAAALGRRFGQNALVHVEVGGLPQLVDLTGPAKIVLDTNVWLDWLLFDDPSMAPIRAAVAAGRAAILIDEACAAELARVLARPFGRRTLDAAAQAAAMAECKRLSTPIQEKNVLGLPACRDPDDQKFLEAAAAARADMLITKDQALLELARRKTTRLPFRILAPKEFDSDQT